MKTVTSIIALSSVVLLSACTGTESSSGSPISSTKVNSYALQGTSDTPESGVVPINSGIDGGAFKVNWNVSSSNPYNVRLYVSNDPVLSSTDIQFFSQNCGTPSSIYNCNSSASFNCSFNTQNRIVCNETSYNQGKSLNTFLNTLPQQAYVVMQACNGLFDSCKTEAVAIELQ